MRSENGQDATHLHHEGSVGGGGDTSGGEHDDGETSSPGGLLEELEGSGELLGVVVELRVRHLGCLADLLLDGAGVSDGLDDVSGSGLTWGSICVSSCR
jgi:hypothetical protein